MGPALKANLANLTNDYHSLINTSSVVLCANSVTLVAKSTGI